MFISQFQFFSLPSSREWFRILAKQSFRSKLVISALFFALVAVAVWWFVAIYKHVTVLGPARGGHYTEAVTGQPRLINPLLAPGSGATSDRLLTKLIFSGLYTFDSDGKLTQDIAEGYDVNDEGTEYVVRLRDDVIFHDGRPLTADDVVFTVNIAKDSRYDTVVPALRVAWRDVEVEKIDEYSVKFTLSKQRGDFLYLLTLGILPQHIWSEIAPVQFQLAEFNIKPIGSGPYAYVSSTQDAEGVISEYILRANKNYYRGEPLITKFTLEVFPDYVTSIEAYADGLVSGVVASSRDLIEQLDETAQSKIILKRPSYFAIFFNRSKSAPLAYMEVREALALATDREEIVRDVFGLSAFGVRSPLFEGMDTYVPEYEQPAFDLGAANKKLQETGWIMGEDGIRVRSADQTRLAFSISLNSDQEQLVESAEILAEQWKQVGAEVSLDMHGRDDLETNVVRPRTYESLFTFHPMRWDQPNLFALWHTKEKDYPGLNYAQVQDETINKSLNELQTVSDPEQRRLLYVKIQERIAAEHPAVFLLATDFLYAYNSEIKGINLSKVNAPQDRFTDVHEWYIKEKRQFKYGKDHAEESQVVTDAEFSGDEVLDDFEPGEENVQVGTDEENPDASNENDQDAQGPGGINGGQTNEDPLVEDDADLDPALDPAQNAAQNAALDPAQNAAQDPAQNAASGTTSTNPPITTP